MKKWNLLLVLGLTLSVVATGMFLPNSTLYNVYASEETTTKITHKSPGYYVPGKRIQLVANVADETGIALVRCYFRASGQDDFVFVPMSEKEKATYSAVLPAVGSHVQSLEYLFLIVVGNNRVVKSQIFTINKEDQKEVPSWQMVEKEGPIQVSTEIAQSSDIAGYYADNIALDVVESAFRFGYVVALYQVTQMVAAGGASGAAATAAGSGTVTATAGGLSTGAIIGIGAGVAATLGTVAVAAGSGKTTTSDPPPPATFTYNEDVIRCGSCYCCNINIYVSRAPSNATVEVTSTWGRSASTRANASGSATLTLATTQHCPCLSGSFSVFVNGSRIGNPVSSSCW